MSLKKGNPNKFKRYSPSLPTKSKGLSRWVELVNRSTNDISQRPHSFCLAPRIARHLWVRGPNFCTCQSSSFESSANQFVRLDSENALSGSLTSGDLSRGGDSWVENEEFTKQRRQWQVEAHWKVGEGFLRFYFSLLRNRFWMSRNASPEETATHNRTTFFSFCVCGLFALCWKDQSHNSKVPMT